MQNLEKWRKLGITGRFGLSKCNNAGDGKSFMKKHLSSLPPFASSNVKADHIWTSLNGQHPNQIFHNKIQKMEIYTLIHQDIFRYSL